MKICDPHIHLIDLSQGNYHWLKLEHPPFWPNKHKIAKDCSVSDLALPEPLFLAAFVHIEAGFDNERPWREIAWLESHVAACQSDENQAIRFSSIGCVDLVSRHFEEQIAQLAKYQSVAGVRHILEEDAQRLLENSLVRQNLSLLAQHNLIFELQMPIANNRSVSLIEQILVQNPSMKITINHCGFPPNNKSYTAWRDNMARLAGYKKVAVKISGLEMSEMGLNYDRLITLTADLVNIFGQNRVMLASNFPVLSMASDYPAFWQAAIKGISAHPILSPLIDKLCSDNAIKWYDLT